MIENLVVGIVSGVISGAIVALALWALDLLRKPPLELFNAANERAVIRNNRPRAVVVGGSWELDNGTVLFRADGFRGDLGGFYIDPFGQIILETSFFRPGQTADVAYKYVKRAKKDGASSPF